MLARSCSFLSGRGTDSKLLGCGALTLLFLLSSDALAAFAVMDVEACPASAGVFDPEFDSGTQMMAFYDWRGALKVAPVQPNGNIGTAACAGFTIDSGVTSSVTNYPLKNGPEWGWSSQGAEIFYTKERVGGGFGLAKAWFDTEWQWAWLEAGADRGLPLVSIDVADPAARLLYVRSLNTGYELQWREASPETETTFEAEAGTRDASAPRWVPGLRAMTLIRPDANGVNQACVYFIDADEVQCLTSGSATKSEAWLWQAPEYGGEYLLSTIANQKRLQVYRQIGGVWKVIFATDAAEFSVRGKIFSPEPMTFEGRSYIAMQLGDRKLGPGEIWMTGIDPAVMPPTLLSDPAQPNLVRIEPEWMVTPNGAFVFYSYSTRSLRRLNTPLATPAASP